MSEVLSLEDVVVRRGAHHLLDGLSLSVSEGQHWVILGPNGAGKTTLLEIVAGRMHPTSGTVKILGEQLGRVDVFELRPRIGYASSALADRLPRSETAFDTVMTAAYGVVGRWTEKYEQIDEERAHDLLNVFGIGDFKDRAFGSLSEGERKRVQIARSLMTDPEILLLDEPASGLDLGGREDLLQALFEILGGKYAPTTLMVTHHVEEIPKGTTHALLLRDGKVTVAGPLEETLTSENLSETFGSDIKLTTVGGRFHAQAQ